MLRKFESFIPPFLKSIDKSLLLNRPGLWATKIHYVLFFTLIGGGLLMLNAIVRPIDLANVPGPDNYFGLLIIPCVLAFGIWAYRASLFHVEKGFGKKVSGNRLRDQLIYAGVIALLGAIPYVYGSILETKIDNSISNEELVEDVNTMNIGIDALEKENSSFYVSIDNQYPLSSDRIDEKVESLNYIEKEYAILQLGQLMDKYSSFDASRGVHEYDVNKYYYEIDSNLSELERSKNDRHIFQQSEFNVIYLFFLVGFWLVLQAFIFTGWKELVLSVVTGLGTLLGLGLATASMSYAFNFNGPEPFLFMLLGCFAFFLFQAYRKSHTNRLHTWKSVSLTLAVVLTPLIPFMLAGTVDPNGMSNTIVKNLLIFGMILGVVVWNVLYQKRFSELQAVPKDN